MNAVKEPWDDPRPGATVLDGGIVRFCVWAPGIRSVDVSIEGGERIIPLVSGAAGYFSARAEDIPPGTRYRFRLDGGGTLLPDPTSRFQPEGHDGPSAVVDPDAYRWNDRDWIWQSRKAQIIYEMHIGTFTREGTWRAALAALPALAELGITVLEIMPVGEFPGRFGWGYDVVHFYAPTRLYGTPDDMRCFIDAAHGLGLAVILDVVYNHCGANGCFLESYSPHYFSTRHVNEWGHAFNFDGERADGVREFIAGNAEYWIRDFHVDGFRFDATQAIFDDSGRHILAEVTDRARNAAGARQLMLVGENEPQDVRFMRPVADGGYGIDAMWNDDFHHTARVALTGSREAYYRDYGGTPQELLSAVRHGFIYQGQHYVWQKKARGTPSLDMPALSFVNFLDNHDQVANSIRGLRIHRLTSPGRYRAMTALLILAPGTPMLFQGQEYAADTPFYYFADNDMDLAAVVREGRAAFLSQFAGIGAGGHSCLRDPADRAVFEMSCLDDSERSGHTHALALHRDLIALRRNDRVFSTADRSCVEGAVLGAQSFVLRYCVASGEDRLLLMNLGVQYTLDRMSDPLLAPPRDTQWKFIWSSSDIAYGGDGAVSPLLSEPWNLQGEAVLILAAERLECPIT